MHRLSVVVDQILKKAACLRDDYKKRTIWHGFLYRRCTFLKPCSFRRRWRQKDGSKMNKMFVWRG